MSLLARTHRTFELTFTEPLLGTLSANRELFEEHQGSKSKDAAKLAEELAALPAEEHIEKSTTVFPRSVDGKPVIWDYHIKGFFKHTVGLFADMGLIPGVSKWTYKRVVDLTLFIGPRQSLIQGAPEKLETLGRPQRVDTLQGPRVALANSEMIPVGCKVRFTVTLVAPAAKKAAPADTDSNRKPAKGMTLLSDEIVDECLNYGALNGMGQWRNGSYGRFTWVEITS